MAHNREMRCSIVVPTASRADYLARCLEHIAALDPPTGNWEVLVTDTSAAPVQPATRSVVEGFMGRIPVLRYLPLAAEGLMLGRHRGVSEAQGRIVAFLDDDSFVSPSWLKAIEDAFSRDGIAMACGPSLPLFESEPPAWLEHFWVNDPMGQLLPDLSLLDLGDSPMEVPPGMVWGCNLAIRKDVFEHVGGSHPDCIAPELQRFQGDGETALATRVAAAGYRALYHPAMKIEHFVANARMTADYFRRRAFYQGVGDSFTDLRRKHGLGPRAGVPLRRRTRPVRTTLWRIRNGMQTLAKELIYHFKPSGRPFLEYLAVKREVAAGYRDGYDFHQREVRNDPALLAWVLREHFLGPEGIPHP